MSKKLIAEVIGTFILVFFGCGAAVIASTVVGSGGFAVGIGYTGIALAFGLAIVAAAYGLGAISGAHLNPAVSLGMVTAGRMSMGDFIGYAIAQIVGAILGAAVLYIVASGSASWTPGNMGANGWGPGYLGEYKMLSAFVFELVMTFIFVTVILGATHGTAPVGFAGLAIGLTLTAIHLVGINVTGVSVNPARSIGPALFSGGAAIAQLWLFILAPLLGGAIAGMLHAAGITKAD